jgi:hypothetical protein
MRCWRVTKNEHAFLWRDGVMTDLGTLGGPNSSVPSPVKNNRGLIVGQAQGSEVDPLGETEIVGACAPPDRGSLTRPDHLPHLPCPIPRWTEPVHLSVPSRLVPASPRQCGVGVHEFTFEACSGFTRVLRPAGLLGHRTWPLSQGFSLVRYQAKPLVSYQLGPPLRGGCATLKLSQRAR